MSARRRADVTTLAVSVYNGSGVGLATAVQELR